MLIYKEPKTSFKSAFILKTEIYKNHISAFTDWQLCNIYSLDVIH